MLGDDDKNKPFSMPTFDGEKNKSQFNQMMGRAVDPVSFQKIYRTNPDGSVTMLATKGGMPQMTTTGGGGEAWADYLYCRFVDLTHPFGVAKLSNGSASSNYAWPEYPVSKGRFPSTAFVANTDFVETDTPGPGRWFDSRLAKPVVLSWACPAGTMTNIDRAYEMMNVAYNTELASVPTTALATPNGVVLTKEAGLYFPGQRWSEEGPTGRFVAGAYVSKYLFRDGVKTAISGNIMAACLCVAPQRHYRAIAAPLFGATASYACNNLSLQYFSMTGSAIDTMPSISISIPAAYSAIISIDHPPVFNASGTEAVFAATVQLAADPETLVPVVLTIDGTTGECVEQAIGGGWENSRSSSTTGTLGAFGTYERTMLTRSKTNVLAMVGYSIDTLSILRVEVDSLATQVDTCITAADSVFTDHGISITNTSTETTTRTNALIVEPSGVTVHTSSGTSTKTDSLTRNVVFSGEDGHPWIPHPVSVSGERSATATYSMPEMVQAVCGDMASGCIAVVKESRAFSMTGGGYAYTQDGETPDTILLKVVRAARVEDYPVAAEVKLIDLAGVDRGTPLSLTSGRIDSTSYAESSPQTVLTAEYNGNPITGSTLPTAPSSYSTTGSGLSGNVLSRSEVFDSLSVASNAQGTKLLVSALHGDSCPYHDIHYADLATTNMIGTSPSKSAPFVFSDVALPTVVGTLGWVADPVIISKRV